MGCPPRLLRVTSPAFAQSGAGSSVARFDKATPLANIGKDLGQGAWLLCDEIYIGLLDSWKQRILTKIGKALGQRAGHSRIRRRWVICDRNCVSVYMGLLDSWKQRC